MRFFCHISHYFTQRILFVGLTSLVLLALIASYFHVIQSARERAIVQAQESVLNKARLVALAHDQWLEESHNLLATVAAALQQLPEMEQNCGALLTAMAQATRGVDTVLLTDHHGDLLCAPFPSSGQMSFRDRAYVQRALQTGEFTIGEYIIGRFSGERILPAALPLRDESGAVRYLVILGRKLAWIESAVMRQRFSSDTGIMLFDGKGAILAQVPARDEALALQVAGRITERRQGVLEAQGVDEQRRYFGFTTLASGAQDAYVAVSVPAAEVLEPVGEFTSNLLLQFAVAAVLIIAVLWFGVEYWVLRPLHRMMVAMDGVRQGDLTRRVVVRHDTQEMTQLAQSFNTMLGELEEADARLRRLSDIDGLLGIANRRTFDETMAQEWLRATREASTLALLMVDVDDFKRYNDTYGHQAGDRCLQQIAAAIAVVLKRPADLVARYGGEEFAVLLPQTDAAGADDVARNIQNEIARLAIPHSASRASAQVTVSIGIAAMAPGRESVPDMLIRAADRALYSAKQAGRNRRIHETGGEAGI